MPKIGAVVSPCLKKNFSAAESSEQLPVISSSFYSIGLQLAFFN